MHMLTFAVIATNAGLSTFELREMSSLCRRMYLSFLSILCIIQSDYDSVVQLIIYSMYLTLQKL